MRRTMPLQIGRAFSSVATHASSHCRLHLSLSLVRSCWRSVAVSHTLLRTRRTYRGTRARKCICRRLILRTRTRRRGECSAVPLQIARRYTFSDSDSRWQLSISTLLSCTCLRAGVPSSVRVSHAFRLCISNFSISLYLCLRPPPPPLRIAYVPLVCGDALAGRWIELRRWKHASNGCQAQSSKPCYNNEFFRKNRSMHMDVRVYSYCRMSAVSSHYTNIRDADALRAHQRRSASYRLWESSCCF